MFQTNDNKLQCESATMEIRREMEMRMSRHKGSNISGKGLPKASTRIFYKQFQLDLSSTNCLAEGKI